MTLPNPGGGPLPTAHEDTARANVDSFATDVCQRWNYRLVESQRRPDQDYGDGRYAWNLTFERPSGEHHSCEVQMFGVSRDYGRGDNPITFPEPRLYVDGSSWVWDFAVSQAAASGDRDPDDG